MTYEDAMRTRVTKEQAKQEAERHFSNFEEFLKEYGDKPSYRGKDVLAWLGY